MQNLKSKKRNIIISFLIISISILLICFSTMPKTNHVVSANFEANINHKSSVLIDYETEKILVDNNAHDKHPIASVTKLMTILLALEHIEENNIDLTEKIIVSENASSMGGSQIFLDANKEYEIGQLLKSIIVASANDSSVALAEFISGSEKNFVIKMNEKSNSLNLNNTHYANCTGLPSNEGYSSAFDQAIVLKHVLNYDLYHEYSSIWMEDFTHPSGRTTQMTNTNKLSRFYEGCIGGKTGSTNQAKYCLAVGAKRNNTKLISVVLGVENSKDRFKLASNMLNYGFSNFENKLICSNQDLENHSVKIKGSDQVVSLKLEQEYSIVANKNEQINYSLNFHLPDKLKKIKENDVVGTVEIVVDGIVVKTINIISCSTYEEPSVWEYFKDIIANN